MIDRTVTILLGVHEVVLRVVRADGEPVFVTDVPLSPDEARAVAAALVGAANLLDAATVPVNSPGTRAGEALS